MTVFFNWLPLCHHLDIFRKKCHQNWSNGNPDISGALYTLRIQYWYTQTQFEDGARDVRVLQLTPVNLYDINRGNDNKLLALHNWCVGCLLCLHSSFLVISHIGIESRFKECTSWKSAPDKNLVASDICLYGREHQPNSTNTSKSSNKN